MEKEVDRNGEYSLSDMLGSCSGDDPKVNQMSVGEFTGQDYVKIYSQLPDYDPPHGFDLSCASELSAISKRIYVNFISRRGDL